MANDDVIVEMSVQALAEFLRENNYKAKIDMSDPGHEYVASGTLGLEYIVSLFSEDVGITPSGEEVKISPSHLQFSMLYPLDISLICINEWNSKAMFSRLSLRDDGGVLLRCGFMTAGITFQHLKEILDSWDFEVSEFQREFIS